MHKLTMSVRELAEHLGISKPTAYKLIRTKGFPVLKLGRRLIIPFEAFQRWLSENTSWRQ